MSQRISYALAVFCLGMALTLSVHAAEPYGFYVNDHIKVFENVNVRTGPSTAYPLVVSYSMPSGIYGRIEDGHATNNGYVWWKVRYYYNSTTTITGWSIQGPLGLASKRTEENWLGKHVKVSGTGSIGLRLRDAPGLDHTTLVTMPEGTVAKVISGPLPGEAYVWWKLSVISTGHVGWSVQRFLKETTAPPPPDTTNPVITLLGSASVTIDYGASYTDAGATASDNVDGNITGRIVKTGLPISTTTPGTYSVRYNVTDTAGNKANQVTRTVTVKAQEQAPTPHASRIIFGNTLGTGWQNGSWGVSYTTGGGYITASYTTPGGELYFHTSGFNTTGYHMLSFFVRPTTVDEPLYVHVHYADGSFSWAYHVRLLDYVSGGVFAPHQFQVVRIPLSALGAHNVLITGITFKNDHATRVGFDEMRFSTFTNQSGVCHEY